MTYTPLHSQKGVLDNLHPLLASYGCPAKSQEKSFFRKVSQELNELTDKVKCHWDEISEEERDSLKSLAHAIVDPQPRGLSSRSFDLARYWLRLEIKIRVIFALLRGQADSVVAVIVSVSRLVEAIMDAIEKEEAEMTAQFLDKLLQDADNNPSGLVPYSAHIDDELSKLLDGVELD